VRPQAKERELEDERQIAEHFSKGAQHWNAFIGEYEGDVASFSGLILPGGKWDLDGYDFPLPVSFVDCVFQRSVHILNAHFESWVDLTGATFKNGLLIEDSICDGEAVFESVRCPGGLIVSGCHFKESGNFDDLDAYKRIHISDSIFSNGASLQELGAYGGTILSRNKFEKEVSFSGVIQREAVFLDNEFSGLVDFQRVHFEAPTVLRGNVFKLRPIIDDIDLTYEPIMPSDKFFAGRDEIHSYYRMLHKIRRLLGKRISDGFAKLLFVAQTEEQYSTLRQFRLFAKEYDDHRLALDIYALELKSRRFWCDPVMSSGFILGLMYQIFSDFGRSLRRPLLTLAISFVCFWGVFYSLATNARCLGSEKIHAAAFVSLNNVLPIAGWQKQALLSAAESCLFDQNRIPFAHGLLSLVQTVTSLILIFLLLLAVRNTVKMNN